MKARNSNSFSFPCRVRVTGVLLHVLKTLSALILIHWYFQRSNAFGTIKHILNGHKDRVNCVKWIPMPSFGKLRVWWERCMHWPYIYKRMVKVCKAQFRHLASTVPGSTVAWQKHDSDSGIVPELYQIQDFMMPHSSSTRRNAIPPKHVTVTYEFCLSRQKHDLWITAVPESCSLLNLIAFPNLIQKWIQMPCFCCSIVELNSLITCKFDMAEAQSLNWAWDILTVWYK